MLILEGTASKERATREKRDGTGTSPVYAVVRETIMEMQV